MASKIYGWDVGYGKSCLYGSDGGNAVVSHVSEAKAQQIDFKAIGADSKIRAQLITNGIGRYWVGLGASELGSVSTRTDYDRIAGSPEVRALLYASLGKFTLSWQDRVHLVVGVPLGFVTGDNVAERIASLKGWLTRDKEQAKAHQWQDGRKDHVANIGRVSVLSQAQAAYLDYVLNDDGTENDNAVAGEVGVISIGHNTVEMVAIADGEVVKRFACAENAGVRKMLTTINNSLGGGYEIAELDVKLREGKLDYAKAAESWSSNLEGVIERGWGMAHARFAKVVAVGGGVRFALPMLKRVFGNRLVQSDDAIQSVARGLYKFGVSQ